MLKRTINLILLILSVIYFDLHSQTTYPPPSVTITAAASRYRVYDNVNFSWKCVIPGKKPNDVIEYRTKLDAPGDWLGGIKYLLHKWSDWQTGEGGSVSFTNFILEGNYGFSVQCRNKSAGKESAVSKRSFSVYWEFPEVREEAFNIDWVKVNAAKSQKEKYRILASEYKKSYDIWSQKWEYEYRSLKATTSKEEIIQIIAATLVEKGHDKLLEKAAGMATSKIVNQILLPKTIYEIIKSGFTDLILVYRNVKANTAASMTGFSYAAWQVFEKASRQ